MSLEVNYKVRNSLRGTKPETKELFEMLQIGIKSLGTDVKQKATRYEVRYATNQVFARIRVNSKNLKVWIRVNSKKFKDPKKIVKTMKWSPPHFFYINSMHEVKYALSLIRQAYDFSKKQKRGDLE